MTVETADVLTEAPLLELFQLEVRAAVQELSAGLTQSPLDGGLVRAARSIRGAARLVGIDAAADIGAALEDVLNAAQSGQRTLTPGDIEALLAAVDVVADIAESPTQPVDVADILARLRTTPVAKPVVRAEPAPAVAAIDQPLLELFREEVRAQTQILNTGLVVLERTPSDVQKIEPLMRAAHSIKGAARVVHLDLAVKVAHAAEDCLVAAQQGKCVLAPDDIDDLLRAADVLVQMAEQVGPQLDVWLTTHAAGCEELIGRLEGIATGKVRRRAEDKRPPTVAPVVVEPSPSREPVVPRSAEPERVVRVTAQSLTRLMGLAGESLVEARWLQPFAGSLLALKKQQSHLAEVLDALRDAGSRDDARELLDDACKRLASCSRALADRIGEFEAHSRQSDDLNSRLYREVLASRMRPFLDGVQGFPRLVRDLARSLGKQVQFDILGDTTDVDRDILEKLEAPLNHLLRNSLDHGLESPAERAKVGKPETGHLKLEARHNAGWLQISVSDDGRGIDVERLRKKVVERGHTTAEMAGRLSEAELLEFLFLPGFSTAEKVTEVSGRGVGLDVVHNMVHAVGGTVRIQTRLGHGTRFLLQLPITLSVIRAVLIEVGGESYAFPLNRIDRLLRLTRSELHSLENRQYLTVDGRNVGIVLGRQLFDIAEKEPTEGELLVVLLSSHNAQYGLVADSFRGEQDLVVRPLDPRLGKVPNIAAAALLDDGSPVLIADVEDLARSIEDVLRGGRLRRLTQPDGGRPRGRKRILVVDDSITVREVQRQLLGGKGYEVDVAVDGLDGLNAVRDTLYDLIVSDIDMPRMNGLDFVRSLKSDDRLHSIPVIIVSYKDREEDRMRGLEVGANYYLTKSSFHDDRLLNVVEELIGDP